MGRSSVLGGLRRLVGVWGRVWGEEFLEGLVGEEGDLKLDPRLEREPVD